MVNKKVVFSETETSPELEEEVLTKDEEVKKIILFNDDHNSFDYVIETLIEVCNHTYEQAEQCALITHYKGKCDVKRGSYEELVPVCTELLHRNLSAEIQ